MCNLKSNLTFKLLKAIFGLFKISTIANEVPCAIQFHLNCQKGDFETTRALLKGTFLVNVRAFIKMLYHEIHIRAVCNL